MKREAPGVPFIVKLDVAHFQQRCLSDFRCEMAIRYHRKLLEASWLDTETYCTPKESPPPRKVMFPHCNNKIACRYDIRSGSCCESYHGFSQQRR